MPKKKRLSARRGIAHGVPRNPPAPVRKRRAKRVVDNDPIASLLAEASMGTLKKAFSRLPNRYWIKGENHLWSSVERGSEAHFRDIGIRGANLSRSFSIH